MKKTSLSYTRPLLIYLLLWPVATDPVSWEAPTNQGYVGDFARTTNWPRNEIMSLPTPMAQRAWPCSMAKSTPPPAKAGYSNTTKPAAQSPNWSTPRAAPWAWYLMPAATC